MNSFTKVELELYNKIINKKWSELESRIDELEDTYLNPGIITEIFREKRWDIAKKLIDKGKIEDLNTMQATTNNTLLMLTLTDTSSKAQEISKILIDRGVKKDCVNYQGLTALMLACENNNVDMFKYLLEHGDDIDTITDKGTLLISAVKGGNKEIIEYVLKNSKNINVVIDNENALSVAVENGNYEIVKMLVYGGLKLIKNYSVVDYLVNTRDMHLICYILRNNNCSLEMKDDIIKYMIDEYDMDSLLEIRDDEIRKNIVRVFFENDYSLEDTNKIIIKLLKSDLKDYVVANYNEYIKAHTIDVYSQNIDENGEVKDIDKIDVILKSSGVDSSALTKYVLILSLKKLFQENVENFEISDEEFNALVAYQLINSMGDKKFRNNYKDYYFSNVMPQDEEILERLEGNEKKDYMVNNLYNWVVGNKVYKDDMYSLNSDITKLIKSDLIAYNVDDLDIVKRASVDKKENIKDLLNYTVLAVKYLDDKITEGKIKNLQDLQDLMSKKDVNLKILSQILNDRKLIKVNHIPQNNVITQNYMNWAIDNSYVFLRGIANVSGYSQNSIHNETNLDVELRKGFRKIGKPTLTKMIGKKDGNQNRSCTMINYGSRVFTEVGLGIISPSINDIKMVASHNIGTGKGKKEHLTRVLKGDSVIDTNDSIENQLKELADFLKRGGGSKRHNEVVIDLKLNDDKVCVFYYNHDKALDFLNAIYIKKKYMEKRGKSIPIFRVDKNYHYPVKEIYNTRKIRLCLKEAFSANTEEVLNLYNIDFLICLKDEINRIPECRKKLEQFIKGADCKNINDCINVSRLIGKYYSRKEQNEYIKEHIHRFIRKENYMSFMKEKLQMNLRANRLDREIDFYLETMDNIAKTTSEETIESIKEIANDTFKKVCEYAINRRHTVDIDGLIDKCKDKEYLTLDKDTQEYIKGLKDARDIKEKEFYKEYNITPKI